jgi:hypothetical protein
VKSNIGPTMTWLLQCYLAWYSFIKLVHWMNEYMCSIQLIYFFGAFFAFEFFVFYSHHNHDGNVTIIPSAMGIHQNDFFRWALFALVHFRALCYTSNHFPFCLFPSIVDDTHIIGPPFYCIICIWTLSNWTQCDKYFYPTLKMCSMVPFCHVIWLQHLIPI